MTSSLTNKVLEVDGWLGKAAPVTENIGRTWQQNLRSVVRKSSDELEGHFLIFSAATAAIGLVPPQLELSGRLLRVCGSVSGSPTLKQERMVVGRRSQHGERE